MVISGVVLAKAHVFHGSSVDTTDLFLALGLNQNGLLSVSGPGSVVTADETFQMGFAIKFGIGHPTFIGVYGNVATAFGVDGDLETCIEIRRELVSLAREHLGESDERTQHRYLGWPSL